LAPDVRRIILLAAFIHTPTEVFSAFDGRVMGRVRRGEIRIVYIALADVHFVTFLSDVVGRGEVGLSLTVEEEVVTESWNGNIARLDQAQMLADELKGLSGLLQLFVKVSFLILLVVKFHVVGIVGVN